MIELNSKTQQDFLNREWVQKLLDAGVDMSDASYYIIEEPYLKHDIVVILGSLDKQWTLEEVGRSSLSLKDYINKFKGVPTYTVSELLYKLRNRYGMYTIFNCYKNLEADNIYIIETLASFLIQCHKKDIGIKTKDTGNISNK